MDTQKVLSDIQSANADTRFQAWREAGSVEPSVIPQLGKLAAAQDPGIAKAAREALTTMTHSVGKDPNAANRAAVVKGLLELNSAAYPNAVRTHALRLLSNIAGDGAVPAIARDLANPDLREEAVYCIERIPGDAAANALITAYRQAKDDFKPRLLAALGHRRVAAGATLAAEAMRSMDKELAIAGARALARIGEKSAAAPAFPADTGLSDWQKMERMDSMLRWADSQVKAGNASAALPIFKAALERAEEHWQCAAIAGIGKAGTAEAAALLMPKLKSPIRNVRLAAQKAWKAMA